MLARLGISRHFERIIDIHTLEFVTKPDRRAYLKAMEIIGARPQECVLVEDSVTNIIPARALGMITVLVRDGQDAEGADCCISSITELEPIIGSLLGSEKSR